MRRGVKKNPLKNATVLRRLNPHSLVLKTQERANNERRRRAREIIKKQKSGEKVDPKLVKKAATVLGLKLQKYKEFKAEKAKAKK